MPTIMPTVLYLPEKSFPWHNEDAWAWSRQAPIFAVADGVTLPAVEELVTPTGAKVVADLFCETAVRFLEERYAELGDDTLMEAYRAANAAIKDFNDTKGELFSTVASVAAVKDGMVFGARLTDCGIALARRGELVFKTPEFWSDQKARGKEGYGALNGVMDVAPYVEYVTQVYLPGDYLLLFSDGFENHFSVDVFIRIFAEKNASTLEKHIRVLDDELVSRDNETYGRERTLLIAHLLK